ncbi:MAG: cytochrome c [Candidatus Eremiobacteraeota bacterium]|nr:cytochrome c [Candidatus Eremiobacteraeota bacterium]
MRGRIRFATLALISTLAACTTATHQANAVSAGTGATLGGDRTAGSRVFVANCATCHGAGGTGGTVGPSLRGESQRMDFGGLVSWIEDPQPPMPKLYPKFLTSAQVRDVAAYVQSL